MWPETPRTEELLERARKGEPEAVDGLLAAHREPLRRMIGLRLDPALAARLDASDVVQDVLLEAHRRLSEFLRNPTMPFPLWLRHIAKDHIIDAHRRHRVAQRRSLDREQPLAPARFSDESSFDLAGQLLDRERTPAYLDADMPKDGVKTGTRKAWTVQVKIPSESVSGQFPDDTIPTLRDSAVYIRTVGPNPACIRIPATGTANEPDEK